MCNTGMEITQTQGLLKSYPLTPKPARYNGDRLHHA